MTDPVVFSTDFRQFEQYLNVTGLDVCSPASLYTFPMFMLIQIAVIGNSYVYHTRKV
jgi:hypothetical protein